MEKDILLNAAEMALIEKRLAAQIAERHPDPKDALIVGVQRRGADLAARLTGILDQLFGVVFARGSLDINLYRDDWTRLTEGVPHVGESRMPFSIDDKTIILVDDVLFSGRTVRSAISALLDYGRPRKVELLVFIDRGRRELPICPDYVGRKVETAATDRVNVFFSERDGEDLVFIEH